MNVNEGELLDQSRADVHVTELNFYFGKDSMFALVVVWDTRDHISFSLFFSLRQCLVVGADCI